MSSRLAKVLVIFIVASIAFCLACVCASMTGPISILPNESDNGGILDDLSAITNGSADSGESYGDQYADDYSSGSSYSSSSDSYVETTTDDSSSDSGSGNHESSSSSSSSNVETTIDSSNEPNIEGTTG